MELAKRLISDEKQNYDFVQTAYNPNNHCFIYVSATYTFGFGKKIKVGNEATQMSGAWQRNSEIREQLNHTSTKTGSPGSDCRGLSISFDSVSLVRHIKF